MKIIKLQSDLLLGNKFVEQIFVSCYNNCEVIIMKKLKQTIKLFVPPIIIEGYKKILPVKYTGGILFKKF